jgi:LysM repeat protein
MINHGNAAVKNSSKYITVTVYKGDTIWSLAAKHKSDSIDIRKLVYEIREENNLKTANIYPGQQLVIPIE